MFFNRDHDERFSRTALFDRKACWQWWTNSGQAASFVQLCPTWQLHADHLRLIRRHVPSAWVRSRLYLILLRHVCRRFPLSRLIVEPITAAAPGTLTAGRRVKHLLRLRKPAGFQAETGVRPEVHK
jgi:hypothetical protein